MVRLAVVSIKEQRMVAQLCCFETDPGATFVVSEVVFGGEWLTSWAFTSQNGRKRLSDRPSRFEKGSTRWSDEWFVQLVVWRIPLASLLA